jgi:AraC-like DNA-binding protein
MRSGPGMKKHITDAMRQWEPGRSGPLAPLDWLKILPFGADAASNRRGWSGLEAARYRAAIASEIHPPAMTHHRLVLFGRPSEELDLVAGPTLEQLAAVARLSPYHFARQFRRATGLPPHQYVIARRVERAKGLLQAGTDLSLAQVAAHAGFSDQSHFCQHFRRIVGVTPGQFRKSAGIG